MNVRALIASPVVVLFLVGTRLLLVSDYDTDTAVTLLRLGGVADTALGTMIPLLPLLLPLIFVILLALRDWYTAAIAAACALLVAFTSASYTSFGDANHHALLESAWFVLGAINIIGNCLWDWISPCVLWGYAHVIKILPVGPENFFSIAHLAQYPHADSWSELWNGQPLLAALSLLALIGGTIGFNLSLTSGAVRIQQGSVGRVVGSCVEALAAATV